MAGDDPFLPERLRGLVRRLDELDQADRIALGDLASLFGGLLAPRPDGSQSDAAEILVLRAENLRLRQLLATLLDQIAAGHAIDAETLESVTRHLPPPDAG